ncbi:P-loop containing nucleoside triphosphate hydrolase protein [Fomes fomentarius]|nr:P-loop containing nucleoside triphosphate hydrolase protein [Fomes fomentarius]
MSSTTLDTKTLVPRAGLPKSITVVHLEHRQCKALQDVITGRLDTSKVVFGVCLRVSKRGAIEAIALATPTTAFLIAGGRKVSHHKKGSATFSIDLNHVLADPKCLLAGANIARLALLMNRHTGAHVSGLDALLLPAKTDHRDAQVTVADLVATHLSQSVQKRDIHALWLRNGNSDLCLRAWLLASVADKCRHDIKSCPKVDTRKVKPYQLACLSQLVLNIELLDMAKPTSSRNEFHTVSTMAKGKLELINERFSNRVRRSFQTTVEIEGQNGQGKVKAGAQAVSAKGRTTGLVLLQGQKLPAEITKIQVVGREELTCAEVARDDFIGRILQGRMSLHASPFVNMLWFSGGGKGTDKTKEAQSGLKRANVASRSGVGAPTFEELNPSQKRVALAMVSEEEPLVIAHGPPGTGKTSTIAAALKYWAKKREPAWVIAQSNVGVQNIAESLFRKKIDFKIIVSMEFHFEWHEHIYKEIERNLIRSDEIPKGEPRTMIGLASSSMCRLSGLSSMKRLRLIRSSSCTCSTNLTKRRSTMISRLPSRRCVCSATQSNEVAPKMQTIFDFEQFATSSYFLDTQYRMPVPLGDFISKEVYDSKLKSQHLIKTRRCVQFIDVRKGQEESVGSSWKNTEEANTIVNIVKRYYPHEEICVITPYDAQRGAITAALQRELHSSYTRSSCMWFVGHESPIIIVSAVRTTSAGFLTSHNRMNVMLTRCKQGMVVVTQRAFLRNGGRDTLLGKLAEHWEKKIGEKNTWADAMEVADGRAKLPQVQTPRTA